MTDTIDVVGAFADEDQSVINWGGNNYYRACGEPVVSNEDGSGSTCVKRVDHPGDIHEDFDGVRKAESHGRMVTVVTHPLTTDLEEGFQRTRDISQILRDAFAGTPDIKVYRALRDQADQVIMILEGDG